MLIILRNILILSFLFTTNCGFKVLNKNEINFTVSEIKIEGDKRTGFKIRNNLISKLQKDKSNGVVIKISTQQNKSIKEKNIKNEITKYSIELITEAEFNLVNQEKTFKLNFNVTGFYLAATNNSTTLSNEKSLIDNLVEELSEKLINEISFTLNDN